MNESILEADLARIREQISNYAPGDINEQNTRSILIEPLLKALGWDLYDLNEVYREYRYQSSDNLVDYALMDHGKPYIFLEAKALGSQLDAPKWSRQIMGYASTSGVPWVVLTDGNEYRIFNAHATVPIREKLFCTVCVANKEADTAKNLRLLSRPTGQSDPLQARWDWENEKRRNLRVDQEIQKILQALIDADPPDASLVRLLRRGREYLAPADIRSSLARMQVEFKSSDDPWPKPNPDPPKPPQKTSRITLKHLIDAGHLTAPLEIFAIYKNDRHTAQIENDGSISFNDNIYTALSSAGNSAKRLSGTIDPKASGWDFWRFRDSDGQDKRIDELRKLYRKDHNL